MSTKDSVSILVQLIESHTISVPGNQLGLAAQALAVAKEFVQSEAGEQVPAQQPKKPS